MKNHKDKKYKLVILLIVPQIIEQVDFHLNY